MLPMLRILRFCGGLRSTGRTRCLSTTCNHSHESVSNLWPEKPLDFSLAVLKTSSRIRRRPWDVRLKIMCNRKNQATTSTPAPRATAEYDMRFMIVLPSQCLRRALRAFERIVKRGLNMGTFNLPLFVARTACRRRMMSLPICTTRFLLFDLGWKFMLRFADASHTLVPTQPLNLKPR